MITIEQIARTALDGDPLELRSQVQDLLRHDIRISNIARPTTEDVAVLAVSAAFTELFAERLNQLAPDWTRAIAGLPEPRFLVRSALTMKRLRKMCEEESPEPLKRRNLFAPPDFLTFA